MEPKGVIAETLQAQGLIKFLVVQNCGLSTNLGKHFGKQLEWLVM